jgi:hypothetical protein
MQISINDIGSIETNSSLTAPDELGVFSGCHDSITFPRRINLKQIDNIEFDQVDHKDHPDYADAYILSADMNGIEMTEEELDELNEDREFVHEKLIEYLF